MSETEDIAPFGSTETRLQRAFREHMSVQQGVEPNLRGALIETLSRPGSLFRAELAFGIATVYGLPSTSAEQLAIALEYFHTASLLFDDLPSMDDAIDRRGSVCIHHLYGEGTTILAALALINRAYALVWKVMQTARPQHAAEASAYLERYLGLSGILDGQSRDIHFGVTAASAGASQQIALEKTASLIRLPLVLPAILGGAPQVQRHLLHRLAQFWGLGYQAFDDLKDVLKESSETGKTTRRDELLHRPNVALELGTPEAIARHHRLSAIAKKHIRRLQQLNPQLSLLTEVSDRFDAETRTTLAPTESNECCFSS